MRPCNASSKSGRKCDLNYLHWEMLHLRPSIRFPMNYLLRTEPRRKAQDMPVFRHNHGSLAVRGDGTGSQRGIKTRINGVMPGGHAPKVSQLPKRQIKCIKNS